MGAVTVKLALALPDGAVAVTANVSCELGQVEGVGDGAVGGRNDVGLMGPRVALVVVDNDMDGLVRCPAGPGEDHGVAGGVVRPVARDGGLICARDHACGNKTGSDERSYDERDLEQPSAMPTPSCWT